MAAPMVSGAAALLLHAEDLNPDQVKCRLLATASSIYLPGDTEPEFKYLDIGSALGVGTPLNETSLCTTDYHPNDGYLVNKWLVNMPFFMVL